MYERFGKRTLDIIIASIATLVFIIPMIIVAAWVKVDSRGPILFKQLRYGKDLKPFTIYKFRTMSTQAPKDTPTNAFKDAGAFITRSGKIIRKLSLDELPQLINVLKSDMSIIGPRPVVLKEVHLIDLRSLVGANSVKPGITGWAQVNGRDELNDVLKARMDGEYVEKLSLFMDIKCMALTVWTVISIKGNYEGNEAAEQTDPVLTIDATLAVEEG